MGIIVCFKLFITAIGAFYLMSGEKPNVGIGVVALVLYMISLLIGAECCTLHEKCSWGTLILWALFASCEGSLKYNLFANTAIAGHIL